LAGKKYWAKAVSTWQQQFLAVVNDSLPTPTDVLPASRTVLGIQSLQVWSNQSLIRERFTMMVMFLPYEEARYGEISVTMGVSVRIPLATTWQAVISRLP